MDENDMKQAINRLKNDLKTYEINKSSLILSIILLITAFLGGGLLLGAIFKSVPLFMIISLFAAVPSLSTKFKELDDVKNDIKLTNSQIASYGKEIVNIKEIRHSLANSEVKKVVPEKPKKKYEYKDKSTEKAKTSKNKDIPIEYFDEDDFYGKTGENNHKKR